MNKIFSALKFSKDHSNNNNLSTNNKRIDKNDNSKFKEKENLNLDKTSRGRRSARHRRKSGSSFNSALGFHPKVPHHLLNHGVDVKTQHNRSVNIVNDSPRSKAKRKLNDRISPNIFAPNQHKNTLLEAEKLAFLKKNSPRSAKLKKKNAKAAERSLKGPVNRHNNSMFNKPDFHPRNMQENVPTDDISFDKDEKAYKKFLKRQQNIQKGNAKIWISSDNQKAGKHLGNKFMMIKRPEPQNKNLYAPYEQTNHFDDFRKMHNNIDDIMKYKNNLKLDSKKKKVIPATKKLRKYKRSATPGISMPQGYVAN